MTQDVDDNSRPCPRCGGPIRFTVTGPTPDSIEVDATDGINALRVHIELNQLDVRRHLPCYSGPGDGEPLPVESAAS